LLAFSPWAILFSRKIWTQNLIVPLMVLLFFSLGKIVVKQEKKYWIPYLATTLFIIQLHQSAGFFLVLLNLFLFFQLKKDKNIFHLKYILIGIILGMPIGAVAGYYRGLVDEAIMRAMDAFLAIPPISATEADKEKTSASALPAEVDLEPPISANDIITIRALIIQ
jgi:hypothetical protein